MDARAETGGEARDFHIHSYCSDGMHSPASVMRLAAAGGVRQVSLTDHDTVMGCDEAGRTAGEIGIDFIPGIEVTSEIMGRRAHILGYGFNPDDVMGDGEFGEYIAMAHDQNHAWAWRMCEESKRHPIVLNAQGKRHEITVSKDEIEKFKGTIPSTFHFGLLISEKMRAISDEMAIPPRFVHYIFFKRPEKGRETESYSPEILREYAPFLSEHGIEVPPAGFWHVPKPRDYLMESHSAIRAILRTGGLPALAHPGEHKLRHEEIERMADSGLMGLEVYTPKHTAQEVEYYAGVARDLGLFCISGTDFHDEYHRSKTTIGKDRSGLPLTRGVAISDMRGMLGS